MQSARAASLDARLEHVARDGLAERHGVALQEPVAARACGGSYGKSISSRAKRARSPEHRISVALPWISSRRRLPARRWRLSTFWVMSPARRRCPRARRARDARGSARRPERVPELTHRPRRVQPVLPRPTGIGEEALVAVHRRLAVLGPEARRGHGTAGCRSPPTGRRPSARSRSARARGTGGRFQAAIRSLLHAAASVSSRGGFVVNRLTAVDPRCRNGPRMDLAAMPTSPASFSPGAARRAWAGATRRSPRSSGEPIAVRTVAPVSGACFPQVIVATNRPERFAHSASRRCPTATPGCGPLAGIHAAMLASRHPLALRRGLRHARARPRRDPLLLARSATPTPSSRAGTTTSSRCTRSTASDTLPQVEVASRCRTARAARLPAAVRVDYVARGRAACAPRRRAQPAQRQHARGARRARRPLRRRRAMTPTIRETSWSTSSTTRARSVAGDASGDARAPPAASQHLHPGVQRPRRALRPPAHRDEGRLPVPLGSVRRRRAAGRRGFDVGALRELARSSA